MITASDIAQALGKGKFGTQKELIWKKVLPQDDGAWASMANCPPIKWGTMYEDVAQSIYSKRTGFDMFEFGLVPHFNKDVNIGASPDGISDVGVMLEIKCPYRRKITGDVPEQYYYQIQGQLECCGLAECDFLEVSLVEESRSTFYDLPDYPERGIVFEYFVDGSSKYAYSGPDWSKLALEAFESLLLDEHRINKIHYWRVDVYSCVRVVKDVAFVEKFVGEVQEIWAKIVRYREDPGLMAAEIGLPVEKVKKVVEYKFRDVVDTRQLAASIADDADDNVDVCINYAFR
jgi:putative phage-type endonuclease